MGKGIQIVNSFDTIALHSMQIHSSRSSPRVRSRVACNYAWATSPEGGDRGPRSRTTLTMAPLTVYRFMMRCRVAPQLSLAFVARPSSAPATWLPPDAAAAAAALDDAAAAELADAAAPERSGSEDAVSSGSSPIPASPSALSPVALAFDSASFDLAYAKPASSSGWLRGTETST